MIKHVILDRWDVEGEELAAKVVWPHGYLIHRTLKCVYIVISSLLIHETDWFSAVLAQCCLGPETLRAPAGAAPARPHEGWQASAQTLRVEMTPMWSLWGIHIRNRNCGFGYIYLMCFPGPSGKGHGSDPQGYIYIYSLFIS